MKYFKLQKPVIFFLFCLVLYMTYNFLKTESFDTEIDQHKKEYDDALEKRIAEVKQMIPNSDAELLLEVNRPYSADVIDEKGWYGDVINCEENGSLEIYCKPKNKWIFPY